jgi:hypothetical protein
MEVIVLIWNIIKRGVATTAAVVVLSSAALATTMNFEGTVTAIPGSPPAGSIFPPIGTAATVSLTIDDSDPTVPLINLGLALPDGFLKTLQASVSVPGFLSGSMFSDGDYWDYSATSLAFNDYGPTMLTQPGGVGYFATGLHFARFNYAPGVAQPLTVGELVLALMAPGTTGFFSHEMERQGGGFYQTRVDFSSSGSMGAVPLPPGLALMLTAVLCLAGFGLRRPAKTTV